MMAAEKPPRDARALFWALVPAILLTGLLGTQLVLLSSALDDPSFAVEEDYYKKATDWDVTMAQERENVRLGWRVDLAPMYRGPAGRVVVDLRDAAGRPIADANVTLEAFPNARASHVQTKRLKPAGPGSYGAALAFERSGLWEFRIDVRRGIDHFTATLRRDVLPEPRP